MAPRKKVPTLQVEYSKTTRKLPGGYVQDAYTATFTFENRTWTAPLDARTIGALVQLSAPDRELSSPDKVLSPTGSYKLLDSDLPAPRAVSAPTGQLDALLAEEESRETTMFLEGLLQRTTPRELAVFAAVEKGASLEEVARVLKIAPSTARVLLHRFRVKARTARARTQK
mgnify:CR=1 FL=1